MKHKSNIEKGDIEEERDEVLEWINKCLQKEEKKTEKENPSNIKEKEKGNKQDSKENDEFQECLPSSAFNQHKVTLETDDEAHTSKKTKDKQYSQDEASESVKTGSKRNGEDIEKESTKRQKFKTKEAADKEISNDSVERSNNFNPFNHKYYRPTQQLKQDLQSKSSIVNEFKIESSKYISYRKSNGQCKIYLAIKDQEKKIEDVKKVLEKVELIEKKTIERKKGKSSEEKRQITIHAAQKVTYLEDILENKLKDIDVEHLEDFTKVIRKENEKVNLKSISANRTYNENYMETGRKEKKFYKELFGTKKVKVKTLPQFSSETTFHPNEKRRQEERKARLNFKEPQISANAYYQKYRKEGEVPHYTGVTLPLLGSENQSVKKEQNKQKKCQVDAIINLDDTVEENDENIDPFKVKSNPFCGNYQKEPATLKQILKSKSLEDNEEKFSVLQNQVSAAYKYLKFMRHPEHMFKNWKIDA